MPPSIISPTRAPTPENLVTFAHAALFSPVFTTLESVLKRGFLVNFRGLLQPRCVNILLLPALLSRDISIKHEKCPIHETFYNALRTQRDH